MRRGFFLIGVLAAGITLNNVAAQPTAPSDEIIAKIKAAAPNKAPAKPMKPRKLLVFTLCRGFYHSVIPIGAEALKILAEKTGAFEVTVSDDIGVFEPDQLAQYDAVCMLNTTGELFLPPKLAELPPAAATQARQRDAQLKDSLVKFVGSGKGLVGIHAATDCFYEWPAYGEMIGGYFDGHPWNEEVVIKLDEPKHPLTSMFGGAPLSIADEIYQFKAPYSRTRQRVLLSIDTARTKMDKQGIKRTDGDFAVSWVRKQGAGRVFYCSLGHRDDVFWNPKVLEHYLAGIQFAFGDLSADVTPSVPPAARVPAPISQPATRPAGPPSTPLFDGATLNGWKGLVGDPKQRAAMSEEALAKAQAAADEKMRAHWKVEGGELVFDGQGDSLCTARDYGDFVLTLEWKIEPGSDSGVYLRGCPQVQIWDAAQHPEGSGGLYNNKHNPDKPILRADRIAGQWNSFVIRIVGDRVTVWLNDVVVVRDVVLENYVEPDKPLYATGQIELQAHGSRVSFRNIGIRDVTPEERAAVSQQATWRELFNGRDLTGWNCPAGSWTVEDGVLARQGGGDIWTADQFGDFMLDFEFKLAAGTNSGVFFRTVDVDDPVQTGIEMQIFDSHGKTPPERGDCGAIFDCRAPYRNVVFAPGEWNHAVLSCLGSRIGIVMNGERVLDMNLDEWTQAGKNPDGTPNKFQTAYKDMARTGLIGLQDHGMPVWYRNIRIRPLGK